MPNIVRNIDRQPAIAERLPCIQSIPPVALRAGAKQVRPLGLLALYGPLSRWAREGWEDETLGLTLAEHAREQFAFLAEVRLDELLARTYSGAELRRRLAALVDAAAPWWAWDEGGLGAEERARACRVALVGLPDADSSPLADVLPDGPGAVSCFSTGDPHQVLAAQVIEGLDLTGLRGGLRGRGARA